MMLLNVSFGIFAFLPQGWLFMAFVIICESLLISKILSSKWIDIRVNLIVTGANIISGVIGIIASILLSGGWYMVVWFPWVSDNEIDIHNKSALLFLLVLYLIAFVCSVIIELLFYLFTLKKYYPVKSIVKVSLVANILSYLVGTIVLYSYSFGS